LLGKLARSLNEHGNGRTLPRVSDVTRILHRVQQGETQAAEELLPLLYEELRKLAAHKLAHEPPGQTLQATALVHEAWQSGATLSVFPRKRRIGR
jgi:hypothetical protein